MLLDANAIPVRDTEEVWRVQALCEWFADARVMKLVKRRGCVKPLDLRDVVTGIAVELASRHARQHSPLAREPVRCPRTLIRRVMLSILRDPVCRRAVAAAIWRSGEFQWADQRQIRRDLQAEREEMEIEAASRQLVWRLES